MTRDNKGSEQPLQEFGGHSHKASRPGCPTPRGTSRHLGGGREDVGEASGRGLEEETGPRGTGMAESGEIQAPLVSRAHSKGTGS